MTTTASLETTELRLDPGAEAVVPLQIRNNGTVVEGYQIAVLGAPAAWAVVEPPTVSLYPGTATTATVTFRPPRSASTVAGAHRFGVMVTPTEHPEQAVVPEGVVEVLPFLETTAELVPRTSQGRRGRHQVAVDNRGNVPVNVLVAAHSDGERLRFKVDPVGLEVPPGEARFVTLRARARKRIWRGQPVTHPFVVGVSPQGSTAVELDGSYVQTPVVPRWLLWLVPLLLGLVLLLLALWFWVLEPTIESQARAAAEEQAERAEQAAEQAEEAQQDADTAANDAERAADEAEEDAADRPRSEPRERRVVVSDFTRRLFADPADNGTATDVYPLEGERTRLALTDVVLSNPQGDFGRVELSVDGDVVLSHALENFRDLDFHFVTPIQVADGVEMDVTCRTPGAPPDADPVSRCDVSALIGGVLSTPARR